MMKTILILAVAIAAADAIFTPRLLQNEWEAFKSEYNKKYSNPIEERFRMKIYFENRRLIANHNRMRNTTFRLGLNAFSDQLPQEFLSRMTGFRVEFNDLNATDASFITPKNVEIPETMDWRAAGAVTPVKLQGNCGGCWTFAATGGLEGQVFRKTGRLVSLSEQNLIDCATSDYHNKGCGGGMADRAWHYVKDNGGIDTEESYPYEAKNGQCRYKKENTGATCQGAMKISSGNEEEMKEAVATAGPVSVSIDAEASLMHYTDGVYYGSDCSSASSNHAVLVVGYGTENGQDYWLVKNSWGTSWGEEGYIKMSRNRNNNCGIAGYAVFPLV